MLSSCRCCSDSELPSSPQISRYVGEISFKVQEFWLYGADSDTKKGKKKIYN